MFATIGLIVDIILVLTLTIHAIIGIKKGLIKSVLSFFSWSVCLIIAILFAKHIANWINSMYNFAGLFGNKIANGLTSSNNFFTLAINTFSTKEELVAAIPNNINGLVKQIIKIVFTNSNVNMESTDTIGNVTGESLGSLIVIVITAILIFIILRIAVLLISKILEKLTSGKVFGTINKLLGCVFGVLQAGITILTFNFILIGLSLIPAVNKTITPIITENTYVEKYVYKTTDNLFEKYVIEGDFLKDSINNLWESRKP